jgi:hypothetical protein
MYQRRYKMYYNTETIKQSRRKNTMVYLTLAQKREVVRLVNEAGLYLLDFYLSKSGVPRYEYTDEKTALAVGWTVKKVSDYRRKLINVDLFRQEVYGTGDQKAVITHLAERFRKDYKGEVPPELVESEEEVD